MADFARALLAGLQAGGNSYVAKLEREKEEQRLAELEAARSLQEDTRWNTRFNMQSDAQMAAEDRQASRQDARDTTQYQREDERFATRDAAEQSRWEQRFNMEQKAANGRMRLQASLSAGGGGSREPSFADYAAMSPDQKAAYDQFKGRGGNVATGEAGKVAERMAIAEAQGLSAPEAKAYSLTGKLPSVDDAGQVDPRRARLAEQARGFASQITGKSPDDVAKMSPEEVRDLVADGSKFMSGPVMGRILPSVTNPGADAYSQAAAGINARLANPTGPVSNADFEVARRSGFTPEKPADVNAQLVYDALQGGGQSRPSQAAPVQPTVAIAAPTAAPAPTNQAFRQRATNAQGVTVEYDPDSGQWVRVQ